MIPWKQNSLHHKTIASHRRSFGSSRKQALRTRAWEATKNIVPVSSQTIGLSDENHKTAFDE